MTIAITQADRDAAARLLGRYPWLTLGFHEAWCEGGDHAGWSCRTVGNPQPSLRTAIIACSAGRYSGRYYTVEERRTVSGGTYTFCSCPRWAARKDENCIHVVKAKIIWNDPTPCDYCGWTNGRHNSAQDH